jgi:Fatty acid hydroxylase superfamily
MQQRAISYFADMVACPLLAGALAIFALAHITKPALVEWCLLVMIGAALWTVTEYFMHRVIYHRIPNLFGMLMGTIYVIVHHACHFWAPAPGGYLYRVRLHHAVHYYRDDNGIFGVTTSFWDRVLGTRIQPSTHHSPAI